MEKLELYQMENVEGGKINWSCIAGLAGLTFIAVAAFTPAGAIMVAGAAAMTSAGITYYSLSLISSC